MGEAEPELVFVYGTLRRGASNHWRMEGAECLGMASVRGQLYRIDWYPGLVLDPGGERVLGEVYQVAPELLANLDAFEGATGGRDDEYRRLIVQARWVAGNRCEYAWAWEYTGPVDPAKRIDPGDWFERE